jgi:molybdopterin-guanine dinucleotide biosynthesis protein B
MIIDIITTGGELMIPVISFIGHSGVGKTTLLEGLLPILKDRGLQVAVIKHHHQEFEIDRPGKDTWRFAQAGAAAVAISAPNKYALVRRLERELTLEEIVSTLGQPDLIITEGYKGADYPKIQVSRTGYAEKLLAPVNMLLAVVADYPLDLPVPVFRFDDLVGIVDFLVKYVKG